MFFTTLTASNIYSKAPANQDNSGSTPDTKKVTEGAMLFLLTLFVIEFSFFIWALMLARRCGARHKDRVPHLVFAFSFPIFYVMYYYISGCEKFDGCGVL